MKYNIIGSRSHYHAPPPTALPNPTPLWQQRAKWIGMRLLFPPLVWWDMAQFILSKTFGSYIGELVLPA